jgi:hypothetical protein
MATVPNKSYRDLIPIRFILEDPDRSLDLSIPNAYASQQGASFLEYNFLLSANDVKNKNYTSNYLTYPQEERAVFDLNLPENVNDSVATTLQFSLSSDRYLTVDKNNTSLSSSIFFSSLSEDDNATQNFVIDLSATSDGTPLCQIWTYDGIYKKYLVQNNSVVTDSHALIFDTITDSEPRSIFNIIKNQDKILLSIYNSTIENIALSGRQFTVGPAYDGGNLILSAIEILTENVSRDSIISIMDRTINTNYVDSSNNFVFYLSGNSISNTETLSNQSYNYLFYNNYEDNFLSGDKVVGKLNYFNLKNQISNNHNINKNLPHVNPQQQRYYTNILNNEVEETSEENLKLNYNFYTAEYRFLPDKYTKFKIPSSILPFESLNINDSQIQKSGAYAALSPYFSDRVYKPLTDNIKHNEKNGSLLCTWLYDDGDQGVWYDRYYLPANISELSASQGNLNQPFNYTSEIDSIIDARSLRGLNYYDVDSSLTFEPSGIYYYARVGKKYVNKILETQANVRTKQNFNERNIYKDNIAATSNTLVFDTSAYDTFNFDTGASSNINSLNLSFELNTPKLSIFKAYQVIGNNYNTGISIAKNFYYTPFIFLQQGNTIYFYDTDFNLIKSTSYPGVSSIRDVCYVSQSNDLILICDNDTGGSLLRVNIAGDIVKENNDGIAQGLVNSNHTSRVFFNIGSKSTFQNENGSGFNVDLLTLVADPTTLTSDEKSVLRRENNTSTGTMSGLRGVNLDNTLGAAISGHNQIIFKDFIQNTTFVALSTNTKIWDINAFDEKLYVQTDNKLKVFNTDRELLSTFNLTTSAVSGFKIDFISEDYKVKPIVLSRGSDYNILVDKIDTHVANTSGFSINTYSLNISSVDLGYDFDANPGVFVSPTNLYSANQTFNTYEDKLCLITKFDNGFSITPDERIWDSVEERLWQTLSAGNWSVNYTGTGAGLDDNSTITVIPNIEANNINCISVNADLITGNIKTYVNGSQVIDLTVTTGIKPLKNYLFNDFFTGMPNYAGHGISNFTRNQQLLAKNGIIRNLNVYNRALNKDLIMYEYLRCADVDPMTFDILTGTRNNIETINNMFSYKIPGSLSNRLKVYIRNGNLLEADANKIADVLTQQIGTYLPMNITNVDYDFSIGNQISETISRNVTQGGIIGSVNPSGIGSRPGGSAGPIELPAPNPNPGDDPGFEPIYDYKTAESDPPIFTQDGEYIYYD